MFLPDIFIFFFKSGILNNVIVLTLLGRDKGIFTLVDFQCSVLHLYGISGCPDFMTFTFYI